MGRALSRLNNYYWETEEDQTVSIRVPFRTGLSELSLAGAIGMGGGFRFMARHKARDVFDAHVSA
jgi:hypothetical protein